MDDWFEHHFIRSEDTFAQAKRGIARLINELGADHFCHVIARPPRDGAIDHERAIFASYPQEWVDLYGREHLSQIDPTAELAIRLGRPFYWGDGRFLKGLRKQQRLIVNEARAVGLVSGLSIPICSPNGAISVFNVVASDPKRLRDAVRGEYERLFVAAYDSHDFTLNQCLVPKTEDSPDPSLSPREKECLLWTAEGKTAEDVAAILGLSVFTVNRHVSNAARKLNCLNKYHAVIRALRAGLL